MIWVVSILAGIAYLKYFNLKKRIVKLEQEVEELNKKPVHVVRPIEDITGANTYTGHLFTGVKQ